GPASKVTATGSGQSANAGQTFANPAVVTVTDAFDNPVSGVLVIVGTPASGPSATVSPASPQPTNGSGQVTFTLSANSQSGPSYSVTFSPAGVQTPATITLTNTVPQAANMTVTGGGQSAVVGQQFATSIVITVTDSGNVPVPGVPVTVTVPTSGASAT